MAERARFLEQVRDSLAAADRAGEGAQTELPAEAALAPAELVETFRSEAKQADARVITATSTDELRELIAGCIERAGAEELVRADSPLLGSLELESSGVRVHTASAPVDEDARAELRAAVARAGLGLTEADYGIAESGTLALLHRPGHGRALSLLPPCHVALLRTRDLVADLPELFARLARSGERLPSALTLVTGPSRTADIEFKVTLGVHGPRELCVVLLEDGVR